MLQSSEIHHAFQANRRLSHEEIKFLGLLLWLGQYELYVPGGTALRRFDAAGFKQECGFYLIKNWKRLIRYFSFVLASAFFERDETAYDIKLRGETEKLEMIQDLAVLSIFGKCTWPFSSKNTEKIIHHEF